jgi:hypothetical protein
MVENANAPGIKIPQSILVRTDSVIDKDLNVRNGAYQLLRTRHSNAAHRRDAGWRRRHAPGESKVLDFGDS